MDSQIQWAQMKSVLVYTVHKAASMFLHTLSSEIAHELGIAHYSINDSKRALTIKEQGWGHTIVQEPDTACFGPIRAGESEPIFPQNLEPYSIILHLRDPKDVLTSLFFSHVYSHGRQKGGFNPSKDMRKDWEMEGIDAFVCERVPRFKERYEHLRNHLAGRENVQLVRYEDMVLDYGAWLRDYLRAFSHIKVPPRRHFGVIVIQNDFSKIHNKLFKKHRNDFKVGFENRFRHKRQIIPGDYKRKLKPETVDFIDREFDDVLRSFHLAYEEV